jgi:shikimate dehydrogenase
MTGLSGATRIFAILGDPIAQVKSPTLLSRNMAARGFDGLVIPAHAAPGDLGAAMAGLRALRNLGGIIATVPHKQAMPGWCDSLTERARHAGAANVLWRRDGGWRGDMTDGLGQLRAIEAAGGRVEGARVLLVGAGGAGSAIAFACLEAGAARLAIHDIDSGRRDALIARLEARFPGRLAVGSEDPEGFDIVSNATPLGMRAGDPLPVRAEALDAGQVVADVVTLPEEPALIAAARARGCRVATGTDMFRAQEDLLVDLLLEGARALEGPAP